MIAREPGGETRPSIAVAIGASIAGSLAAGVLSDAVEQVLVVERDPIPDRLGPRRGVPHAQHFHALLARGRQIMEEIFPGFTAEAVDHGALLTCMTKNCLTMRRYGWAPRFDSNLDVLLTSRELIEWTLRRHALRRSNVEILADTTAVGLEVSDGRVTGVQVRRSGSESAEVLRADLVVEASGRQSRLPDWLAAEGYVAPDEVKVDAHWGYTSCFVRVPEGFDPGFKSFSALPRGGVVGDHPSRTRGVSMWTQDGDHRWILTAMGSAGDHPPADSDGFFAFIASVGYEPLDKAVRQVTLIGSPRVWRNTVNRLRRYDLADMPDGIAVVGDAFAAFNPVYGQGMTVAALGAANLRQEFRDGGPSAGLGVRVQRRLAADALYCWGMSTGADYRVDGVVGPPPPSDLDQQNEFADRLEALSLEDNDLYLRFWETAQLIRTRDWLAEDDLQMRVRANWNRLGSLVGGRR